MMVTLPLLLLLLDWWPLRRLNKMALLEKAPMLLLSLLTGFGDESPRRARPMPRPWLGRFSLTDRLAHAVVNCWRYTGRILWPAGLTPYYPLPGLEAPIYSALDADNGRMPHCLAAINRCLAAFTQSAGSHSCLVLVSDRASAGSRHPASRGAGHGGSICRMCPCWNPQHDQRPACRFFERILSLRSMSVIRPEIRDITAAKTAAPPAFFSASVSQSSRPSGRSTQADQMSIWKNSLTLWQHALAHCPGAMWFAQPGGCTGSGRTGSPRPYRTWRLRHRSGPADGEAYARLADTYNMLNDLESANGCTQKRWRAIRKSGLSHGLGRVLSAHAALG